MATLNGWQRLWVAVTVPVLACIGLLSVVRNNGFTAGALEVFFGFVVLWVAFSGFLYVVGLHEALFERLFPRSEAVGYILFSLQPDAGRHIARRPPL